MDLEQLLKTLGVEGDNLKSGMDALGAFVAAESKKAAETEAAKAAAETKGLKDNATKLLDEKKQLQQTLESLGDIDHLKQIKELVDKDEDLKLIKDGKVNEFLEKKTKALVATHQQQTADITRERDEWKNRFAGLDTKWRGERLSNAVGLAISGAIDGAKSDIVSMAPKYFTVDDEGVIHPKEGADVWSDGRPVTLANFNDYLKASKPWLYPGSAGSGAPGGDGKGGSQKVVPASQMGANLEGIANGTVRVGPG